MTDILTGVTGAETLSAPEPAGSRDSVRLTPAEARGRRARSIAIGAALAALVVLFYVATLVKMGAGFVGRPL